VFNLRVGGVGELVELSVTRNATCSPMSTALSPTRSIWRDTKCIRIPHSSMPLSAADSSTASSMPRFSRSIGVVHIGELTRQVKVAARECVHRHRDHPQRDRPHLLQTLEQLGILTQVTGEPGDLGQVHRLVGERLTDRQPTQIRVTIATIVLLWLE
jgi:hypothetical protein